MAKQPNRARYRLRLAAMLSSPPTFSDEGGISSIEGQAHWAKYACVLVSGFVEQAIKEILLSHAERKASPTVYRYVEKSWSSSRNMSVGNICDILESFNERWRNDFTAWIGNSEERKAIINNLISWRNNIAHGNEANTNGVTINSVKSSFSCACSLVDFLEELAR